MSSKSPDPHFDYDAGVLINRYGIVREEYLRRYEYHSSAARRIELHQQPVQGSFDIAHIREIHRRLFSDVYQWAGEFRAVELALDNTPIRPLKTTEYSSLEAWGDAVLNRVQKTIQAGTQLKSAFVDQITQHYIALDSWSPFRTGNGRTFGAFMANVAEASGYYFNWRHADGRQFREAAIAAQNGNHVALRNVVRAIAFPERARSFENALERQDPQVALHRFSELAPAFRTIVLARQQLQDAGQSTHSVERTLAKVTARLQREINDGHVPQEPTPQRMQQLLWYSRALTR